MATKDQISTAVKLVKDGSSIRRAAARVGIAESTLRYHINGGSKVSGRNPLEEKPTVRVGEDSALIISEPSAVVTDPNKLMDELGLSHDDWRIDDVIVNCWGDPGDMSYQLKLRLKPRMTSGLIMPATHVPAVERAIKYGDRTNWDAGDGRSLTVVVGDQQAPFHDLECHRLFLAWLQANQPEFGILTGDTLDFPSISRHKDNPEWDANPNACIQAGYEMLRDYVEASPGTRWTKLLGNHDERIRNEQLLRAERLYGIRPAATGEDPDPLAALSLQRLLHLDTLGIELIEPHGGYQHAQADIAEGLVVRHGWLTGANTAAKSLQNVDFSMIVGHTHKQSQHRRITHGQDGEITQQIGTETGCMCLVKGGLGYATDPTWSQGFATATVWDDGGFNVELAVIQDGQLRWRDERYW